MDITSRQFIADFLTAAVAQKECSADVYQDVIAEVAAWPHQASKLLGVMSASAAVTGSDGFHGFESSDVQGDYITLLGLEHLDWQSTISTVLWFVGEVDRGRPSEQKRGGQFANETAQLI